MNTFANSIVTVGFFDGVHAGHRFLIKELINIARDKKLKSVVITFQEHPRKVLHQGYEPQLLSTPEEKKLLLLSTGVDEVIFLPFNRELASLSARDFIHQVLLRDYQAKMLLVGHDHRFGHNREDDFSAYVRYGKEIGMEVIKAAKFNTTAFAHISSSEIRNALQMGEVQIANQLLTYNYGFKGLVIKGFQVGRKIGFPTANIQPLNQEKLLPGSGVYAVYVSLNDIKMPGMMNIGIRPTLANGNNISMEVHIFNFDDDIYQQEITVIFVKKIRDEIKFRAVNELIHQLGEDKKQVLELFQ